MNDNVVMKFQRTTNSERMVQHNKEYVRNSAAGQYSLKLGLIQ